MNEKTLIDVCLATYKRPELLADTLHSLTQLDSEGLQIRVVVIDNDRKETARATVVTFQQSAPFEVVYDVEPVQNIALARNRALSHVQSAFFAFVDDDETVPPNWLTTLIAAMLKYDADAVFGPVEGLLPADAPDWARVQPSFCRLQRATGSLLEHGATNNVLVRRSALGQPPLSFDPAYGLSGGEDADFFYRMHHTDRRLIWCDEAVVTEHVPTSRLTLKWLRRRGFRSGQSFVRVFVSRYHYRKKVVWFAKKFLHLVGGIIAVPFVRLISYPSYVRVTVRIMATVGQLSGLFSRKVYEEYRADRYK